MTRKHGCARMRLINKKTMNIKEAKQRINRETAREYATFELALEDYDSAFNHTIRDRLMELDPKFMKALNNKYIKDVTTDISFMLDMITEEYN